MTPDEMAALMADDRAASLRQRLAEISEEINAGRMAMADVDDLHEERREIRKSLPA